MPLSPTIIIIMNLNALTTALTNQFSNRINGHFDKEPNKSPWGPFEFPLFLWGLIGAVKQDISLHAPIGFQEVDSIRYSEATWKTKLQLWMMFCLQYPNQNVIHTLDSTRVHVSENVVSHGLIEWLASAVRWGVLHYDCVFLTQKLQWMRNGIWAAMAYCTACLTLSPTL